MYVAIVTAEKKTAKNLYSNIKQPGSNFYPNIIIAIPL